MNSQIKFMQLLTRPTGKSVLDVTTYAVPDRCRIILKRLRQNLHSYFINRVSIHTFYLVTSISICPVSNYLVFNNYLF